MVLLIRGRAGVGGGYGFINKGESRGGVGGGMVLLIRGRAGVGGWGYGFINVINGFILLQGSWGVV